MADLHHFYHIYSNGSWETPLGEHIEALKLSGLLYELSSLNFGIVGNEESRNKVKDYLINNVDVYYEVCTEVDEGWEQETLDKLLDFSQDNSGYIFYAHTKNAVDKTTLHIKWRNSMTYFTVMKWRDNVSALDTGCSAAGTHYLAMDRRFEYKDAGFFGGNFWWTNLKYIRKFPKPLREGRFDAESWIGHLKHVVEEYGEHHRIADFLPFHPANESMLVADWRMK